MTGRRASRGTISGKKESTGGVLRQDLFGQRPSHRSSAGGGETGTRAGKRAAVNGMSKRKGVQEKGRRRTKGDAEKSPGQDYKPPGEEMGKRGGGEREPPPTTDTKSAKAFVEEGIPLGGTRGRPYSTQKDGEFREGKKNKNASVSPGQV